MTVKVTRKGSVTQAVFLSFRSQLIEDFLVRAVPLGLVRHHVLCTHSAMGSHLAEGQLPILQLLHQVWPRNVQQVSSLLRRQLCMNWDDGNRITVRLLPQHL